MFLNLLNLNFNQSISIARLRFFQSLCREIPRRSRCQFRRVLAHDLPPGLKSQRVNQLLSHPRVFCPDFTGMNSKEQRDKGAVKRDEKGEGERYKVSIRDFLLLVSRTFLAETRGIQEWKHLGRGHARITLFPRPDTHVLSRSPGSRDERALRASLKAAPDSKPRPSPATLAPGPPPLFPSHLLTHSSPSLVFLSVFLSYLPPSHSLFFPFRLPWNSISVLLCPLCSIFVSRLSSSFLTLSSARELPPEMLSSSTYTQFRIIWSCPSMTARIGRWPIFLNAIADELF